MSDPQQPNPGGPPPAYQAPGYSYRPIGTARSIAVVIILSIVTCGIYYIYWAFKTGDEIKLYSGQGLGGVANLILAIFIGIVLWFTIPNDVASLYRSDGNEPPVSAKTGFWNLIPIVGTIIWFVKVQGALNDFWVARGAQPA